MAQRSKSTGSPMTQVINFQQLRLPSTASGPRSPKKIGAHGKEAVSGEAYQRLPGKEDLFRAVLLLDVAAQQADVLVKHITDPSRRKNFEAQIAAIQQLLQLARDLTLKL